MEHEEMKSVKTVKVWTDCEYCGPICYRGAAHNARVEAGDRFDDPTHCPACTHGQNLNSGEGTVEHLVEEFSLAERKAAIKVFLESERGDWVSIQCRLTRLEQTLTQSREEVTRLQERAIKVAALFGVCDAGRYLNDWETKAEQMRNAANKAVRLEQTLTLLGCERDQEGKWVNKAQALLSIAGWDRNSQLQKLNQTLTSLGCELTETGWVNRRAERAYGLGVFDATWKL